MSDEGEPPRRRRRKWVWLAVLAVAVLLPILAVGVFALRFNPNAYAPALVSAMDQATGRTLTIKGPIRIGFSLTPLIEADDITLSNPPGFADADLLSLKRVKARIALLPLLSHRVDISQLLLEDPQINLERNAAGQADWDLSRAPEPAGKAGPAGKPAAKYQIALAEVQIRNAAVLIRSAGTATSKQSAGTASSNQSAGAASNKQSAGAARGISLTLPMLTGKAESFSAPLHLTAQALLGSAPVSLTGVVGPIARLTGADSAPWPVDLKLTLGGATATVQGGIAHPRTAQGYDLTVAVTVPALETLTASLPAAWRGEMALPPVHNITVHARIVDQNSVIPAVDDLSIKTGASDLSALRPGLSLSALDIEMASLDQPLTVQAAGSQGGVKLSLKGAFGPPQALFNADLLPASMPPQGSFPVSVQAQAGAATLTVKGAIATPDALAGAAIAVNGAIPDLAALSPLAGVALPGWKNIMLQTTLVDPGGLGLRAAMGLDDLAVSMDHTSFGGDASLYFGAHPRLQAAVKFSQLDVDALQAAMPPEPMAAAATGSPATGTAQPGGAWPDWTLPVGLMRSASADVQMGADRMVWNKAVYTALQGHAVLAGGVLTLDPLTGELPGGSISASGAIDASRSPSTERLRINAPALALAPFLQALGLPGTAEGTIQARLAATSTGDSLPDMAAHVNGQLGLASVNGVVDAGVMNRMFRAIVHAVGLPPSLVSGQGPVALRCLGVRVDATNGLGTIRTLTLDSSRVLLQGGGTLNFADHSLDVVLSPEFSLAGGQLGVPVSLTGDWDHPATGLAPASTVASAAKSAVGLPVGVVDKVLGGNSLVGKIAGQLGIGPQADVCPAALSLGRLGQPGPAAPKPASATPPAGGAAPASGPQSLLNALFGK